MRLKIDNKRATNVTESEVVDHFLDEGDEDSFTALFRIFSPQLVAFFRRRGHELVLAEDLAQEVMLTVYRKAGQIRDRTLFRAWLFKIASNAMCRHFAERTREVSTIDLGDAADRLAHTAEDSGGTSFEFQDLMTFLAPPERDVMTLRFVEGWEYHEIAAAQAIPIGTVQWRVFNSKKKLSLHLNRRPELTRRAA